jgi:hypothetical protein
MWWVFRRLDQSCAMALRALDAYTCNVVDAMRGLAS